MSCHMASERNNASGDEGRLNLGQDLWRAALALEQLAPPAAAHLSQAVDR